MKKYWIILTLVVVTGISISVMIVYNAIPHAPKPELVYLNTDSMKEAHVIDTIMGPSIRAVYLCEHTNTLNDTIPWADAYLCVSNNRADSLSGDSLIVYLNAKTPGDLKDTTGANQFMAEIQISKKNKKCKIMLPPKLIDSIKRYKYKYGRVFIVSEY
jgi:hypothetical protein